MTDHVPPPPREPDDRENITLEEALAALDIREGDRVHSFIPVGGAALVGADWGLAQVRDAIEQHGAEISGPNALAMRHGVTIRDLPDPLPSGGVMPIFFATREEWNHEQLRRQGLEPT
jgi:hypothetical protein